jgi:hypothetical protein
VNLFRTLFNPQGEAMAKQKTESKAAAAKKPKTAAKRTTAATRSKAAATRSKASTTRSKAAATKSKAAATKSKAAAAKSSAGATKRAKAPTAKQSNRALKAPSVQITLPASGATSARPFKVKCKATGVSAVNIQIARTALIKAATLVAGFWEATITATDITPTPAGKQDTVAATGVSPGGAPGDSIKVRIT